MARSVPDWPMMLRRDWAAAYCDLTTAGFCREVQNGNLPLPVQLDGQEHWSRTMIDEHLERLTGQAVPDWRTKAPLYARG